MAKFHSDWFERQMNGGLSLDLDGAGASTINIGIVTESVIDAHTTILYSSLTPVGTATGWTGPVALSNLTAALDGSNDWVFDADDPAQIAQDAGGFTNGRTIVVYDSVSSRILYSHTEGSAFGNVAGPLTIGFSASGMLKVVLPS